jgi:hypothetical protein
VGEPRERCQFCREGAGRGLTASARVIARPPVHEQWHTRTDLVSRTIGGRAYRLCTGCGVRHQLHDEQRSAQATRRHTNRERSGQLCLDLQGLG